MSFLAPAPPLVQHFDNNVGIPLTGGKLFSYLAGTTTKQATYTDATGITPNTNPIILNSRGECEAFLSPGLAYKFVLSPATDTDPPTNPIFTVDNIFSTGPQSTFITIGSIATLKSFPVSLLNVGSLYYVNGYTTVGDGGEGWFLLTNVNPGPDNGGTIIWSNTAGLYFVRQYVGTLSVKWFGARGDNTQDDTSFILAAEAARASGQTLFFPSGIYKITANLIPARPGTWDFNGCTINSTNGIINVGSSNVQLLGNGATINFISGSNVYAMQASGDWSAQYTTVGAIAVGDTSFVAASAGNAATVSKDDWIVVGEWNAGNWQRLEWKQVDSVSGGTTINVTSPFRRAMGTQYTLIWQKVTTLIENVLFDNFNIITSSVSANIGIYCQIARRIRVSNNVIDMAAGLAIGNYVIDSPVCINNTIRNQPGRASTGSSCTDGLFAYNVFQSKDIPSASAWFFETGAAWNIFDGNTITSAFGSGGAAVFSQWCDYNTFRNNTIVGDGNTNGLYILGGEANLSTGNNFINLLSGIIMSDDPSVTPTRQAISNVSNNDIFKKNSVACITVGGTANAIFNINDDGSNAERIIDSGIATAISYAFGVITFTPSLTFATPGDLAITYSVQSGRFVSQGRFFEFEINLLTSSFTHTTSSGIFYITGLPASPANIGTLAQPLTGTVSGWTKASYTQVTPIASPADTRLTLLATGSGQLASTLGSADIPSGSVINIFIRGRIEI